MRKAATLLVLVLLAGAGIAQEGAPPKVWESTRYKVRAVPPAGWEQVLKEAKPHGSWIDLTGYTEKRTGAKLTLSVQATPYRTADEMIADLKKRFSRDAGLAVLRDEVQPGSSKRPKSVLFEYTYQLGGKPQHAVAVYWLFRGKRYRVYGTVREVGWRSVGTDIQKFIEGVRFTGREFSKNIQNFTDEKLNFRIYFPEDFTIRLPRTGAKVVFESKRLGLSVYLYVSDSGGGLAGDLNALAARLKEGGARIEKKRDPSTHPALGLPTASLEYTRTASGQEFSYRETLLTHRKLLYRLVLAGSKTALPAGEEIYARMVRSFSFLR